MLVTLDFAELMQFEWIKPLWLLKKKKKSCGIFFVGGGGGGGGEGGGLEMFLC